MWQSGGGKLVFSGRPKAAGTALGVGPVSYTHLPCSRTPCPAGVRGLLACVALLPMPLQLAASLSPDASVLGIDVYKRQA